MQIVGLAKKVTIHIGEGDKWGRRPLYMAILEMLKKEDCAGATVIRALAGFGAHSRIHSANIIALSVSLPLVVEWIDNPDRIERVMPHLREMVTEGLITVQDVEVAAYSYRRLLEVPAEAPVYDIMSREVRTVKPETALVEVVELLLNKAYRALPVINDDGQLVGILTEGDLLVKTEMLATSVQHQLTDEELTTELQRLHQTGRQAKEMMVYPPITITAKTTIAQTVNLMVDKGIKRLPVVDADNRLQGIVSRVDLLRVLSQTPVTEVPREKQPPISQLQVDRVMTTNVPTVSVNALLAEVVGLLVNSGQRRVVVIDDNRQVVGIITDGDLIKQAAVAERIGIIKSLTWRTVEQDTVLHLSQRTAGQVMTRPVITVFTNSSLEESLCLLLTHKIKRLPVVNSNGEFAGLVGRWGILRELNKNL